MKKQMLLALWLPSIAIIVFISSCKKTSDVGSYQLRQYGTYQFGASIDGIEFVPKGDVLGLVSAVKSSIINYSSPLENDWYCSATIADDGQNYQRSIVVYINNFKGVGSYSFNLNTNAFPYPRPKSYGGYHDSPLLTGIGLPDEYFMTSTRDTGYINCIRYDAGGKEFQFTYTCRSLLNTTKTKTISGTIKY